MPKYVMIVMPLLPILYLMDEPLQQQLATKLNVAKETIRSWERGITKPVFENFEKLTAFFDKHQAEIDKAEEITGKWLKRMRQSYGLSQAQVAEKIGVSKQTIGLWERGIKKPDLFNQKKLRKIFKNPDNLAKGIPQRKCAICGRMLSPKAKKFCRQECRQKADREYQKRYKQKLKQAVKKTKKPKAKAQSPQLTLFDVSRFTKSDKHRGSKKRRRKSAQIEAQNSQLTLW